MELSHKALLDRNYMLLTELIRLKSIPLIKYLFEDQAVTEESAEKSISQAAFTLKAMHLLDQVMEQDQEALNSLYAASLYTKLWRVSDLLEPQKKPHKAIDEEPVIPLPDQWPIDKFTDEIVEKKLEVKLVEQKDDRMLDWYKNSRKNNIYMMNKKVKGRALIINNFAFENYGEGSDRNVKIKSFSDRSGTHQDAEGLDLVLTKLGFEVDIQKDKTAEEMRNILKLEMQRDHGDYNCFFLILLSHGNKGIVFGTDGYILDYREPAPNEDPFRNYLKIEDIRNGFAMVETLQRKPKVFIIQACQGSETHQIVTKGNPKEDDRDIPPDYKVNDPEAELESPFEVDAELDSLADTETQNEADVDGGGAATDENQASFEDEIPDDPQATSDQDEDQDDEEDEGPITNTDTLYELEPYHFLIALATTEGSVAYRSSLYGSWFIQAFIYVLSRYAYKEDLQTLMLKVNALVGRAKREKESKNKKKKKISVYKTVSQTKSTFIKKFFFFPGLPFPERKKPKQIPFSMSNYGLPNLSHGPMS